MWKTFFKEIKSSLIHICFPAFCVCCEESVEKEGLCSFCAESLQLIDSKTRCPHCFEEKIGEECRKDHPFYAASCCESQGPAVALVHALDPFDRLKQKNIGSLMVVQLCLMGWPMPDLLIPFPPKDPAMLGVAKQMLWFLQAEVRDCLTKQVFPQENRALYSVGKRRGLSDKNCLVVSLRKISEEEKESLFESLQEADPKGVFFLSFTE